MELGIRKHGELNNHYYNRLSNSEKKVYRQICDGLKKRAKRISLSQSISSNVRDAIARENPQFFYVNLLKLTTWGDGMNFEYHPEYILTESQTNQVEKTIRSMLNSFRSEDEELTIRKVHNYLVKNIEYDYSNDKNFDYGNHTLLNVFTKRKSVCEGISLAYQYLLQLMDIECVSIDGILAGGNHRWNIVSVDGYTYHVDVTSDMGATQKGYKKPSYFCYMITDKEIAVSHSFTDSFNCIQTKDNPFYKTGRVFANRTELSNYLATISKSTSTIYFKYLGRDLTNNEMFNFVISNTPRSLLKINWSYVVDDTNTLFCFHR